MPLMRAAWRMILTPLAYCSLESVSVRAPSRSSWPEKSGWGGCQRFVKLSAIVVRTGGKGGVCVVFVVLDELG